MLTVAPIVEELGYRLGQYAGLADIPASLAWAAREMGMVLIDPLAVADDDIDTLATADVNRFLDYATYRATLVAAANADDEMFKRFGIKEDPDKVRPQLERQVARLLRGLEMSYGYGLPTLQSGVMNLNFASGCGDGGMG